MCPLLAATMIGLVLFQSEDIQLGSTPNSMNFLLQKDRHFSQHLVNLYFLSSPSAFGSCELPPC